MNTTDTTPKHSPEPWELGHFITLQEGRLKPFPSDSIVLLKEDFNRARTCVNALAGIEDPESWLKQLKEEREQLIEALEKSNDLMSRLNDKIKNNDVYDVTIDVYTMAQGDRNIYLLTKLKGEQP